jgi:hypothetical protein
MSFGGNGSIVASANMKKVKRHDASAHSASYTLDDRLVVRDQFNLSPEYIHLATFALASHPQPVLEAIQKVPPCKLALSEEPAPAGATALCKRRTTFAMRDSGSLTQ